MALHPNLNFGGSCREAFTRYQEIFGGELGLLPMTDASPEVTVSDDQADLVMHAALRFEGHLLWHPTSRRGTSEQCKGCTSWSRPNRRRSPRELVADGHIRVALIRSLGPRHLERRDDAPGGSVKLRTRPVLGAWCPTVEHVAVLAGGLPALLPSRRREEGSTGPLRSVVTGHGAGRALPRSPVSARCRLGSAVNCWTQASEQNQCSTPA